jgi:ferric-dicitrate binding protein FerR (iron transport regulator)
MAGETSPEILVVELADGVFVAVPAPQAQAADPAARSHRRRLRNAALALVPMATAGAAWWILHAG